MKLTLNIKTARLSSIYFPVTYNFTRKLNLYKPSMTNFSLAIHKFKKKFFSEHNCILLPETLNPADKSKFNAGILPIIS